MIAVFTRELKSYMNNMTGHVFIAFLLLFFGVCVTVYNLFLGMASFRFAVEITGIAFLVIVPIITMRSLAKDRANLTDNHLFSLPLKVSEIIIGKFLATALVLLIPTGVMMLYPLILSAYGTMHYASSYSAILSLFLLGLALISIGMFISSLTESQVIAAVISFGTLLFLLILPLLIALVPKDALVSFLCLVALSFILAAIVWKLTQSINAGMIAAVLQVVPLCALYYFKKPMFEGLFHKIMTGLSLYDRFYALNSGVFDIGSVVYLLSVTVFFLFISVQSLETRRWS
ncbi:MAG TPA: ABC transporter permease subunit [Clostridiales bacterium]|jgi:ABC-2 type transport system permease protein|nr:ABC transporter permease subunit [Clostridiales bacterium]